MSSLKKLFICTIFIYLLFATAIQQNSFWAFADQPLSGNISINPENSILYIGGSSVTIDLKGGVNSGTAPYTYEWYVQSPGSTNWQPFSALNNNLPIQAQSDTTPGTYSFKFVVTDGTGASVESNVVQIAVKNPPEPLSGNIVITPQSSTVIQGNSYTIKLNGLVNTGNPPYLYGWYVQNPNGNSWSFISSSNNDLTVPTNILTALGTYSYKFTISDSSGSTITSNIVTIQVEQATQSNQQSAQYCGRYDETASSNCYATSNRISNDINMIMGASVSGTTVSAAETEKIQQLTGNLESALNSGSKSQSQAALDVLKSFLRTGAEDAEPAVKAAAEDLADATPEIIILLLLP